MKAVALHLALEPIASLRLFLLLWLRRRYNSFQLLSSMQDDICEQCKMISVNNDLWHQKEQIIIGSSKVT
ncbi:hypothetical protein RJT34_24059 [Clitoria ternatea]|uniref:Uncharacterized protein n=1 Tax=Clitoria ternatea TaxID=43366 RepID=A0AAN9FM63_CLITE